MAEYLIQDSTLTAIADAIRSKTGESATMSPTEFPAKISDINVGLSTVETEIDLDNEATNFASGAAIEVTPEVGQSFSKVTIPVPDNLIAENIAEGVNIAGVIGSLAAGGGAKVTGGSFVGTGQDDIITHNLGVVPDLVFVGTSARWTQTTIQRFAMSISLSRALATKLGWGYAGLRSVHWKATSSSSYFQIDSSNGMTVAHDEAFGTYANSHITEANETTFKIYLNRTMPNKTYYWVAIGGLT